MGRATQTTTETATAGRKPHSGWAQTEKKSSTAETTTPRFSTQIARRLMQGGRATTADGGVVAGQDGGALGETLKYFFSLSSGALIPC